MSVVLFHLIRCLLKSYLISHRNLPLPATREPIILEHEYPTYLLHQKQRGTNPSVCGTYPGDKTLFGQVLIHHLVGWGTLIFCNLCAFFAFAPNGL
jgi:hypothetical protein